MPDAALQSMPPTAPPTAPPGASPASPQVARRRPGTALPTAALASGLHMWRAAVVEGARYWSTVPHRGFAPLTVLTDAARWAALVTDRRPPTWSSPHTVVWSAPLARLRDFTPQQPAPDAATDDEVVPTILVPPQAGHDSCIVDFSPEQSQVKVALAAGLTRLFSLDWVGATAATKDATIEDYIAVLDRALDSVGGRANLVGDCQGGWLATIYAALRPERVATLTIAGAPIDFTAGAPPIRQWIDVLGHRDLAFYRRLVAAAGGVLPGRVMLNGFIALKPEAEVEKQFQLLSRLDGEHADRYRVFEDWFKHTQDIPGAFYLWIVEHLFRDNKLVRGELVVGGERVDLGRIRCPVNLLGGATDHITPPAQVFAAAEHIGTPAEDVTTATTSGGHLGLFMGSEALRRYWPKIFATVAAGNGAARPAAAEAGARVRAQIPPHDPLVPAP